MSFIDNIIVGIEGKERYDEVIEEVVKQLVEINLYIKPESYKWKVREVGFLEVVMRPERMKMEEEKAKSVLKWLTPE